MFANSVITASIRASGVGRNGEGWVWTSVTCKTGSSQGIGLIGWWQP